MKLLRTASVALLGALSILAAPLQAQAIQGSFAECAQHFPVLSTVDRTTNQPTSFPIIPQVRADFKGMRALCFNEFAILHSGQTKTPLYVVERLNAESVAQAKSIKRKDKFYEEARLPSNHRAKLADYKSALYLGEEAYRFDRGHMAPAGNMSTKEGMAQSFSLSNIVPQTAKANRGGWAKTEADTRKYAARAKGDVYTYTGPYFSADVQKLGHSKVWVPAATFKLVYDVVEDRAWAHWLENSPDAKQSRPISYRELVKRTGIEFLPHI